MNTEQTYHFGIPTPLDTPAGTLPSPEDWLAPGEALKAVGLWIRNEADRRAWQTYYSPHVRYAVRHGDQWLSFSGPYRVMLDGSLRGFEAFNHFSRRQNLDLLQRAGLLGFASMAQLRDPALVSRMKALPVPQRIAFTSDPDSYLLSYPDIQRIRKSSPFLYDSCATTAIQVDTRKVYYQQIAKDRQFTQLWPSAPGPESRQQEQLAFLKAKNRYRSEWELYGQPTADLGLDGSLKLLLREEQVCLLEEPWELKPAYRKEPGVYVAPLFLATPLSRLPEKYRGPWGFENIANRFIGLEMQAFAGHSIEGDLFAETLGRAQTMQRLQQDDLWGKNALPAPEPPAVSLSLFAFFAALETQAAGFFSEHRKHAELRHDPACIKCGISLSKPSRGRTRVFCNDCTVLVSHLERRWQRDFNRRRYPYRFTNHIKLT